MDQFQSDSLYHGKFIAESGREIPWVSYPSNLLLDGERQRINRFLSKFVTQVGFSDVLPTIEFLLREATSGPTSLRLVTICFRCGKKTEKTFAEAMSHRRPGSRWFCSPTCAGCQRQEDRKAEFRIVKQNRPTVIQKHCELCAKAFTVPNTHNYLDKRFCSGTCRGKWTYAHFAESGIASSNAKHGMVRNHKQLKLNIKRGGPRNPSWLLPHMRDNLQKRRTVYHRTLLSALELTEESADVMMESYGKPIFVDILMPGTKIVIEVDGSDHAKMVNRMKDKNRDRELIGQGYSVFRVWNWDVAEHLPEVLERIRLFSTLKSPRIITFSPQESWLTTA